MFMFYLEVDLNGINICLFLASLKNDQAFNITSVNIEKVIKISAVQN